MSTLAFVSSKTELEFAASVREGLTKLGQKELHSRYLYDDLGSALFEAITLLPEYGLTRADARLLRTHALDIARAVGPSVFVAELGSGTGQKTRPLLNALGPVRYYPIDVSQAALDQCVQSLQGEAEVHPILDSYLPGTLQAAASRLPQERMLVLFLGSTIGNFERPAAYAFLAELRERMHAGDSLLIGADLVKPVDQLLEAYDDPTGVTAAFNLNCLARINRELGANFNLRAFRHESRWDAAAQRVEMHLRSLTRQRVSIPGAHLTVSFEEGESIWTESSHKYRREELAAMADASGFRVAAQWVDREWPFAESLWTAR